MPNVLTGLSAGTAATNGSLGGGQYATAGNVGAFTASNAAGLVQKAYDRLVEFALRAQPLIRSVADKRPARQAMPGSSVVLQTYNDMQKISSSLSETVDPDSVGLATPNQVTITLNEYGNAALVTRKLQLFSLADVDPAVANIIAYNMADSIDDIAQSVLIAGTNVIYGGTASATNGLTQGTAAQQITSNNIRRATAKLRANKAVPRKGSMYWAGIHPEVSIDLRQETGAAAWRDPHVYSTPENIWAGEIGSYEGAFFVESPRLWVAGDGANATYTAPTTVAIAIDANTGVATVTTSGATPNHSLVVGDFVAVSGTTGVTGLNATWQVATVISATQFTFFTTLSGTVAGTPALQKKSKVYRTIIAGQQALAEAVAEEPHVVIGPVTDKLMRFRPIGWYGVLGFARYREDALYRLENVSSIA